MSDFKDFKVKLSRGTIDELNKKIMSGKGMPSHEIYFIESLDGGKGYLVYRDGASPTLINAIEGCSLGETVEEFGLLEASINPIVHGSKNKFIFKDTQIVTSYFPSFNRTQLFSYLIKGVNVPIIDVDKVFNIQPL